MDESIDNKLSNIINELNNAVSAYVEKFIRPVINHMAEESPDFFELSLAQDKINSLETQHKLYLAEKFPTSFTQQEIDFLNKEKDRFSKRIRAWENNQFPTREG